MVGKAAEAVGDAASAVVTSVGHVLSTATSALLPSFGTLVLLFGLGVGVYVVTKKKKEKQLAEQQADADRARTLEATQSNASPVGPNALAIGGTSV